MSLTNLNWYVNCIKLYSNREDSKTVNEVYLAAVNYCNKCGIKISYLDNLLK